MLIKNTSSATITIGTVSLAAGSAQDVPWQYVVSDEDALNNLISGALVPMQLEGFDWSKLARPTQGTWQALVTLSASEVYPLPGTLFVGAFHQGRLYFQTTAGTATFSLKASADGATTWFDVPDFSPVSLSTTGDGTTSAALPAGTVLLQGTLTAGSGGWTGLVEFTLVA